MLVVKNKLSPILLNENHTLHDVINNLNKSGFKIVCIVDKNNIFNGIITDGDIRRAILKNYNLNSNVKKIINYSPVIYKGEIDLLDIKKKINKEDLDHLPIIKKKKIVGIYIKRENKFKNNSKKLDNFLIIMAGGIGKRLKPLTNNTPKAMLTYKGKPLIEYIINNGKINGVNNFVLSIYYKKKKVKNYFKDGNSLGVNISYLEEKKPMGTIGAIGLLKRIYKSFFVFNCDSIVEINLEELIKNHNKHNSIMTIVIKNFKYDNPYGVVKSLNHKFISFEEKPSINFNINCGIYVFKPAIIKIIKNHKITNIIELINILQKKSHKISVYPIYENWQDFGQDTKNLKSL
jgi:hypothetical protein